MAKDKWKSHWDKNDPAEVARNKLRQAIKKGLLTRSDWCELCGGPGPTFGHHYKGYSFALDVWFVCISCNTRLKIHDGSQSKRDAIKAMSAGKKTDNHDPRGKLALRRYFLEKYHADGLADVLDCCQGGGVMWTELRKTHQVRSYWGLDLKPKKGRLKLDSVRVLQQPGWNQNVIDVDTYGSPWKHWVAILANLIKPLSVFLTIGNQGTTSMQPESHGATALGMQFPPSTPPSLSGSIARKLDVDFALAMALKSATIIEAVEAVSTGNARYIGVRLEPIKTPATEVNTPKQAKHRKAVRS